MNHATPRPDPIAAAAAHRYDADLAQRLELKWQQLWAQRDTFVQPNPGQPGFDPARPKFYCLDMFPYPSGAGLHVGHPEGYTATDIVCRYKRMRGFNVLHPMGWDAFGLPAEQYAIQTGVHPAKTTRQAIDAFRRQLQRFGFSYDWSRELGTIDEDYYRWTQWIFLKIYNAWYDTDQDRARPIAELIELFERDERTPMFNPDAAEYAGAGDLPTGAKAGPWSSLDAETRRAIIDSYRLAYAAQQTVNWCPALGTALANEEVIDGRSERGGHPVYRKPLKQWMFRITAYADRLLRDLDPLDWPQSTKTQQAQWIGRSEGAEIDFALQDAPSSARSALRVYTTRPDTLFGATYMVLAPEHPLVAQVLDEPRSATDAEALRAYVQAARNRSDVERQEGRTKTGVPLGMHATNPATGKAIPIWVADYVLIGYGHGAIMAVPAHDERDFEFARKYELPIVPVVEPDSAWLREHAPDEARRDTDDALTDLYARSCESFGAAFTGDGLSINSANDQISLHRLPTTESKQKIINWLESNAQGVHKVNYRLRDWLFSRQRYWGEPMPIVWDAHGWHHAVDESALPVRLPEMEDYHPIQSGDPQPLLAKASDWAHTTAGAAGAVDLPPQTPVQRECNTMPGWAGSCWYFLRYCDPRNRDRFASREAEAYWMAGGSARRADIDAKRDSAPNAGHVPASSGDLSGVDLYIGGAEHAVLHLLYARFWHKALYDLGEVSTPEPFAKLFHQGLITSFAFQRNDGSLVPVDEVDEPTEGEFIERQTGRPVTRITAKMSKSLKNVVNPDDVIARYGADTFRLYEMYLGPLEATKPWNPRDIIGLHRFLQRAWRLAVDQGTGELRPGDRPDEQIERALHRAIAKVGPDIERLAFNTAIAAMIEFVNLALSGAGDDQAILSRDQLERFCLILSPFAPIWPRRSGSAWGTPNRSPSSPGPSTTRRC